MAAGHAELGAAHHVHHGAGGERSGLADAGSTADEQDFAPAGRPSGQQCQCRDMTRPDHGEVTTIQRGDFGDAESFGGGHDRSVGSPEGRSP